MVRRTRDARYFKRHKDAILQRRKDRRAAQRAQRLQAEPWRESSDPEIRSGYREPDEYEPRPPDAHEYEDAAKLYEKAAKTDSPELAKVALAEVWRVSRKHGIEKTATNEEMRQINDSFETTIRAKTALLDIDAEVAAHMVLESD